MCATMLAQTHTHTPTWMHHKFVPSFCNLNFVSRLVLLAATHLNKYTLPICLQVMFDAFKVSYIFRSFFPFSDIHSTEVYKQGIIISKEQQWRWMYTQQMLHQRICRGMTCYCGLMTASMHSSLKSKSFAQVIYAMNLQYWLEASRMNFQFSISYIYFAIWLSFIAAKCF